MNVEGDADLERRGGRTDLVTPDGCIDLATRGGHTDRKADDRCIDLETDEHRGETTPWIF